MMMMSKWPHIKRGLTILSDIKLQFSPSFSPRLICCHLSIAERWDGGQNTTWEVLSWLEKKLFAPAKEAQNTMLDSQRLRIRWRVCWELFKRSFKKGFKLIVTIIPSAKEGRYCSWSGKFCCLRVYWGASDSFYIVLLSLHLYFCALLFCISSSISWIRQVVCRLLLQ